MVILFLYALSAVAGRVLLDEEQRVFQAIWGISDPASLISLEENPKQFWLDRENDLLQGSKKVMTHSDFCQQYVKDAKIYMAQQLQGVDDLPWFADPETIERILKEYISEDHPGFAHTQSIFYAVACDLCRKKDQIEACKKKVEEIPGLKDHIVNTQTIRSRLSSEKAFRNHLQELQPYDFAPIMLAFSDKLRWRILPNDGKFPMIDCLTLRRKGLHMCSVSENFEERSNTFLHYGQFEGWLGSFMHDFSGHAGPLEVLSYRIEQKHGVSYQDYFNICCSPDALEARDLFSMSRQVQAWFMHFREVPSIMFETLSNLPDMLLPRSIALPDSGFMDVTPYFLQPPQNGWRNEPLIKVETTEEAVNNQLWLWYTESDGMQMVPFLREPEKSRYLSTMRIYKSAFPSLQIQKILNLRKF